MKRQILLFLSCISAMLFCSCSTLSPDKNLLLKSSISGDLETAQMLLDKGVDVNTRYGYGDGLAMIWQFDTSEELDRLNKKDASALILAATNRRYKLVELYVSRGADVTLRNGLERTALIEAARQGGGEQCSEFD